MQSVWKFVTLFFLLAVGTVTLAQPTQVNSVERERASAGTAPSLFASLFINTTADSGPTVSEPVIPTISLAVRDLPDVEIPYDLDQEFQREILYNQPINFQLDPNWRDPRLTGIAPGNTPAPLLGFDGMSLANGGSGTPPDTVGDVGPNHYVQAVNVAFSIYDKQGNLLEGPHPIKQLWQGGSGICTITSYGDPVVLYDWMADRWVISQFASNNSICLAVSQTSDPAGSYYLYEFTNNQFPDYFKLGVWHDAYYMGANQSGQNVHAYNRLAMLNGLPATKISFSKTGVGRHTILVPADHDGDTPPPAGTPGLFYRFIDGDLFGGVDRIELFQFHADFATPANSTFTGPISLPSLSFASLCNFNFSCIRQQGTNQRIDSVTEWPMWRFAYRNFGTHEVLLGNHAVNVGNDQAGMRWFELRRPSGGNWSIYQESTLAPDAHSRWMASIAMDKFGNIAVGYNASSSSLYPSLRYATRNADDPLNTLQAEASLKEGGGSQTGLNRWGDYSALSVDPADDCTFWFTGEYYQTTANNNWKTYIGAFRLPECGGSGGPNLVGTANMQYGMNNGDNGTAIVELYDDGTFVDDAGNTGLWAVQPSPLRLLFAYNDGSNCNAFHTGNLTAGAAQGVRICTDGSGAVGLWSATITTQNPELLYQ